MRPPSYFFQSVNYLTSLDSFLNNTNLALFAGTDAEFASGSGGTQLSDSGGPGFQFLTIIGTALSLYGTARLPLPSRLSHVVGPRVRIRLPQRTRRIVLERDSQDGMSLGIDWHPRDEVLSAASDSTRNRNHSASQFHCVEAV
jgi:hypothetical protein